MKNLNRKQRHAIYTVLFIGGIYGLIALRNSIAYRDIDKLRSVEVEYISNMDMTIINYDGFEGDVIHGGFTWYKVKDKDGFLYELSLGEWNGQTMLYSMKCLNAVSNN